MLTWHCCRYGELSAAAEILLHHEAFSVCQGFSVVHEHVSSLSVSRAHRESASLRAWGRAGETKSSGAATALDSPAATSESPIAVR